MKLHLILPVAKTPATISANKGIPLALRTLRPDTAVEVTYLEKGYEALDTLDKISANSQHILKAALAAQSVGADGIFINCFADPAVDFLRQSVRIPVLGAFRSSLTAAALCQASIAVIIPGTDSMEGRSILDQVMSANADLSEKIVHIGFTNLNVLELSDKGTLIQRLIEFATEAHQTYNCSCMILGCTAMSYIIDDLRQALLDAQCPISVIEPLASGLKLLEMLVQLHLNNTST